MSLFRSVRSVADGLLQQQYLCNRQVATTIFLAGRLGKPLLVEGPAGAGKTSLAAALAGALQTRLIRLQCYPGLDEAKALYQWNYQKQLLYIQAVMGNGRGWEELRQDIYTPDFLLARPLLEAFLAGEQVVLLVDEVDKSDEELESFFLEALSEFQVTIPELGTVRAKHIPFTLLTSNSTRELSDALKRRCLYLYLPYPDPEQERAIIALKVPGLNRQLPGQIVEFVQTLRRLPLKKSPSIAETLDWARTLLVLEAGRLDADVVAGSLNVLLKYREDVERVREQLDGLLPEVGAQEQATSPGEIGLPSPSITAGEEEGDQEPVDLSRFNF
ncbi:MAG: MoxR family ATPase [Thermoanaerobacteraceae bacterium]|nr:MoxR family ATPase [Thermoanaerobacteraceae bacterium]